MTYRNKKKRNKHLPEIIFVVILFVILSAANALSGTEVKEKVAEEIALQEDLYLHEVLAGMVADVQN